MERLSDTAIAIINDLHTSRLDYQDVFPGRLQKLRERRRMSRRALGERCDLSKTTIRKYERGEAEPKATAIVRLAEIFDTSTDYLLGNTDYPGKYPK